MNDIKDYDITVLTKVIEYNHQRYLAYKNNEGFELIPEYERILKARYQKCSRIKRRFVYLLTRYKHVWFCTFTFSDKYINKSSRTKRDLIKSCINNHDFVYILNIDYGKKTEREHYHCVLGTNLDLNIDKYFSELYPCHQKSIQCKSNYDDFMKLSKYINKLTNHCLKATNKRQRILYNFKGYDDLSDKQKDKTYFYYLDYFNLFDVGLT